MTRVKLYAIGVALWVLRARTALLKFDAIWTIKAYLWLMAWHFDLEAQRADLNGGAA